MVDFVRKATKKSLLSMLRKADKITPKMFTRFLDAVVFKDELESYLEGDDGASSGSSLSGFLGKYLKRDGSTKLTNDWDAGSQKITAKTFESDVTTGTSPLTVSSTTKVTNLNADKLDGYDESDFDYSLISGNDAGTDVSAAELEELTDGSATTLHDHDVTGLTGWGGPYLPLSAGSGKALTGDLYIDKTSLPSLYLRENASATSYTRLIDYDPGWTALWNIAASGTRSRIDFDPQPQDNSSLAEFRFFRTTNTSGEVHTVWYKGDGTATAQHEVRCDNGDVDFCKAAGDFNVGAGGGRTVVGTPNSSGATLFNGSISFYLDESGNNLMVEVKYSDGTAKSGTVCALT